MESTNCETVQAKLAAVFSQELHIEVPSVDTDLFDSGILDSQRLVELLLHLEQRFNTRIEVEDLEIENFRCIEKIATFILRRQDDLKPAQLSRVGALSG
ncbi:MAG: acyl carrier protein [Terriglobales bacterium]